MNKREYLKIRKKSFKILDSQLYFQLLINFLMTSFVIYSFVGAEVQITRILCIPILSILMFRSFSLMHDGTHGALSKSNLVNTAVGILAGTFCFLPFSNWKQIHQEHHFWSGNIDRDPSMSLIKILPNINHKIIKFLEFCWKSWIPIMAFLQHVVFWSHSVKILFQKKNDLKTLLSVFIPIAFWSLTAYFSPAGFIISTLTPSIYLYLIGVEIINFPHHLQRPHLEKNDRLQIWEQHLGSRTCIYPRLVSKYIVLNFNFHIEHHLFPEAPWYYLQDLHLILKDSIGNNYITDKNLNWNLQNRDKTLFEIIASPKLEIHGSDYAVFETESSMLNSIQKVV